ncbi:MAG: hypothetical protein ACTSYI_18155 [Promethearchaeota archaeon]
MAKENYLGNFIPLLVLFSLFGILSNSILVNIVPISFLIWPQEPFHAFEMGLIVSALFWGSSGMGLLSVLDFQELFLDRSYLQN